MLAMLLTGILIGWLLGVGTFLAIAAVEDDDATHELP